MILQYSGYNIYIYIYKYTYIYVYIVLGHYLAYFRGPGRPLSVGPAGSGEGCFRSEYTDGDSCIEPGRQSFVRIEWSMK